MIATTTSLWVGGLYRGPLLVEVEGLIQELHVAGDGTYISLYILIIYKIHRDMRTVHRQKCKNVV